MRRWWMLPWLLCTSLACGVVGIVENVALLNGPVYWTAATSTAVPTVTVFLGTTTPVYGPTAVPAQITTTPMWTTVTATPLAPPPTITPFGFTATPFWVTTTPFLITETPESPVTTTPALPLIGFSTPQPQETPYYRVGHFYMDSDVQIGGPDGLVLRLTGHETQASPQAGQYHYLTIDVTNHSGEATIVPVSDVFFIRHVIQTEETLTGRWVAQNEPLLARGLPTYDAQQLTPLPDGETRSYTLGFVTPPGEVEEVGLITAWQLPLEGGLPVWFQLEADPAGPFIEADHPPPPTAVLPTDGSYPHPGGGQWPATGLVTRGFGCHQAYTGIDGSGYGCPPDRPWFHNGIDIAGVSGTAIYAPLTGTMLYAGPHSTGADCRHLPGSQPPHTGLGSYQRLGDGTSLHYLGHLSSFIVTSGAITAGEEIARMGSTGCSTGTHLHWTVYHNGTVIDPAIWATP